MFRSFMLVSLLSLAVATVDAPAEIYRCSTESRVVEFTDRPCPGGEDVRVSAGTGIDLPALTETETKRVRELDARNAKQRAHAFQQDARATRARAVAAAKDRAACANAARKLEQLRDKRRRGYRLNEDARMNAEETAHRTVLRERCE
jgi:hypothetical protein